MPLFAAMTDREFHGRHGYRLIVAALLLLGAISSAGAQTMPPPPSDQSILHLTETTQRDVPRDLLRATLAAESVDPDVTKVQSEINQRMAAALARAKQVTGITIETSGYSVYRDNPEPGPGKPAPRWHGSQSVTLTGKDFTALLTLAGALQQQGLVMQALTPDLSREARQAVEDSLTDEALTRLQQRAARVAAAIGTKVGGFHMVSVGNVSSPPPPIRYMATAAPSAGLEQQAPVAEAGNATVSITVTGDITLAPR
jgi:predicted secreted protein